MPESLNALWSTLAAFLPNLIAAILVLVVGWLIALAISKLVESVLHRTALDDRLAGMLKGGQPERISVERWISLAVFWLIMLFVILAFLQTLNLDAISIPINAMLTSVMAYLPRALMAAALILLAWVIATVLRLLITRVMSASGLSQRLSENANMEPSNRITIGQTIGNVVYWLVFLLFLPAILDALQLQGMLAPVQAMVNNILTALPNILGAVVIFAIGYFVARIIRQIVANLLSSAGVDRIGERTGMQDAMREQRLSNVIATIVFVLIMIPVAIAALNFLNIPAVSQPAANMLNQILLALPAIFGAFLVLVIAYFVARLVGTLVSSLLAGIGFNRIFSPGGPIPVSSMIPNTSSVTLPSEGEPGQTMRRTTTPGGVQPGRTTPAEIVGYVVMVTILLFAAMEAARLLGFAALTLLIAQFIVAAWNILFGLVLFGIGLWLATTVYRMIRSTGSTANAELLATVARIAIIIFAGALALRQMGIADSIVNLAFGLLLGAVAIAAAIAFGIGGQDVAQDLLNRWRSQVREKANQPIPQTGSSAANTPTNINPDQPGPSSTDITGEESNFSAD